MPQRWSITQLIWAPVGFAHRPAMWPEPWLAAAGSQEQETDLWLRPLVLPFMLLLWPVVLMAKAGLAPPGWL